MSSADIHHIVVTAEQSTIRLDKWLGELSFVSSRTRAAELIDRGLVTLNGKTLKASQKISAGATLRIEIPAAPASRLLPLDAPLDVLHEDQEVIVVNKPSGLVVHPAAGHAQDTLVNILLHHVDHLSMGFNERRPGIVHRLDRDTSGILVVAKTDFAHKFLAQQFRTKQAHRIYWALVNGKPKVSPGTVRSFLARHPTDRKRFASNANGIGKSAVTHYKTLQTLPSGLSWLQCQLETGRTHQIRVHLSESGLPILGDPIYGGRAVKKISAPRMALHACELAFEHPHTRETMHFKVGWPPELAQLARELGFKDV